jgi:hypothetical protein
MSTPAAARIPVAVCPTVRKYGFDSRKAARRFINSRRGVNGFRARWEYQCAHCGFWHVTSSPPRSHPMQPDDCG